MLDAAVARLRADGWTSGLENVTLEDAVRDADVSRTAAYRCWSRRDEFVGDLLVELAAEALPIHGDRGRRATAVLRAAIGDDVELLATVDGRRAVLRRAVVASAVDDLLADREEWDRWQLYLGLATAVPTLAAGAARERVAAAVAAAESAVLDRLEDNYRRLLDLFGFGPVGTYRELAGVGLALMRGLVIGSLAAGPIGAREVGATAFGYLVDAGAVPADQSTWGRDRRTRVLEALTESDVFVDGR